MHGLELVFQVFVVEIQVVGDKFLTCIESKACEIFFVSFQIYE